MNLRTIKVIILISILTCLLFPINSLAIDILEPEDLGSLFDGLPSVATGVNNQGHVVGYGFTTEVHPWSSFPFLRTFFWTPEDRMIEILGPHQHHLDVAINDLDQVVVTYQQFEVDGFEYSYVGTFSCVWTKDLKVIIPPPTTTDGTIPNTRV